MKVVFLTEGGSRTGFGHITRCVSLCEVFEEKGISPEFIVNGDDRILGLLKGKRYKMLDWLKDMGGFLKIINKADIVIIDSYLAGISFYVEISRHARVPVYIDDNKRIDYPPCIVVNGAIYAMELDYPASKDFSYLLGPEFLPMRREFLNVGNKIIKEKIRNILITLGGEGHAEVIAKLKDFVLSRLSNVEVEIVDGNRGAEDMVRLMLAADMAISAGGQTLYELARTGTPTLGICMADNQIRNLKGWSKYEFLKYCGWYDSPKLFKRLDRAIMSIQDKTVREGMKKVGQSFVDGKGAHRVVDVITGVLNEYIKNR